MIAGFLLGAKKIADLVPSPVYAATIVLLGATLMWTRGEVKDLAMDLAMEQRDHAQLRSDYNAERARNSKRLAEGEKDARETERQLRSEHTEQLEKKDDRNKTLASRADRLVDELRRAETRALTAAATAGVPRASEAGATAETCSGGSPTRVLAHVGEADVRAAERADLIRSQLLYCEAQYDGAKRALDAYTERLKALNQ